MGKEKIQPVFGILLVVVLIFIAINRMGVSTSLATNLLAGILFGYVLQRGFFGFAGTVRRAVSSGSSRLAVAVLVSVAVSVVLTTCVLYFAGKNDVTVKTNFYPINMAQWIGGFLFGLGMIGAGSCASGMLTDVGSGFTRAIILVPFFCLGTYLGMTHLSWWTTSIFWKGPVVNLGEVFSPLGGIIVSLLIVGVILLAVLRYEKKRIATNRYSLPEVETVPEGVGSAGLLKSKVYHKIFAEQWSLSLTAILLAVAFVIHLLVNGKGWGITTALGYWGGWFVEAVGGDASVAFPFIKEATFEKGPWVYSGTWLNIGMVGGALAYLLMSGRFVYTVALSTREVIFYVLSGAIMGYSTRISRGCNIGAFYTSVSMQSLAGWTYAIFVVIGGLVGMKLVTKFKIRG